MTGYYIKGKTAAARRIITDNLEYSKMGMQKALKVLDQAYAYL